MFFDSPGKCMDVTSLFPHSLRRVVVIWTTQHRVLLPLYCGSGVYVAIFLRDWVHVSCWTVLFCRKMGTMGLLEVLTFLITRRQRMVTQRYERSKDNHCVGLEHAFHETIWLLATLSISVFRPQSVVLYLNMEQFLRRFPNVSCRHSED